MFHDVTVMQLYILWLITLKFFLVIICNMPAWHDIVVASVTSATSSYGITNKSPTSRLVGA